MNYQKPWDAEPDHIEEDDMRERMRDVKADGRDWLGGVVMACLTIYTSCSRAYEESSEEMANAPSWCYERLCPSCCKTRNQPRHGQQRNRRTHRDYEIKESLGQLAVMQ